MSIALFISIKPVISLTANPFKTLSNPALLLISVNILISFKDSLPKSSEITFGSTISTLESLVCSSLRDMSLFKKLITEVSSFIFSNSSIDISFSILL